MHAPIFLMCSERSGSNLITRILDAHSSICGPGPTHLIRILAWNRARYGDLADDANWSALVEDAAAVLGNILAVWKTRWDPERLHVEVPERSLKALIETVYNAEAVAHGKSHLMIKENQLATLLPFLVASWPDARFIFMSRDPRDMAASWKRTSAMPGGVERAAAVWQLDQYQNLTGYNGLYEMGCVYHLRYEDLLATPKACLADMCAWIGFEPEAGMLAFHEGPTRKTEARRIHAWQNLEQPLMRDNTGKYRRELCEDEIRYVEAICGREMHMLGYRLDFEATEPEALADRIREISAEEASSKAPLGPEESALRARRLAAIDAVLARPLPMEAQEGKEVEP